MPISSVNTLCVGLRIMGLFAFYSQSMKSSGMICRASLSTAMHSAGGVSKKTGATMDPDELKLNLSCIAALPKHKQVQMQPSQPNSDLLCKKNEVILEMIA